MCGGFAGNSDYADSNNIVHPGRIQTWRRGVINNALAAFRTTH